VSFLDSSLMIRVAWPGNFDLRREWWDSGRKG